VINLISFKVNGVAKEFKRVREEFSKEEKKKLRLICNILVQELRDNTPEDTGFAKAQWKLVENKYNRIVIKNEAPYIRHLNMGSSKQAPRYFIERTALKYGRPVGAVVNHSS